MSNIKKYIPNILSITRLTLAFIFPLIFFRENFYLAIVIFFIGALTEFLDGCLARKWKVKTEYGNKIDHMADKWFMGLALLSLAVVDNILVFILFIVELLISKVSTILFIKDTFFIVFIGKIKLIILYITIIIGISISINSNMEIPFWILIGITFLFQLVTIISYFNLSFQQKIKR